MNASRAVQVEANASFTRRMLTVTCAPIFKSCSRIVPHVTRSKSVPTSPMRRSASIGTKANDDTPDALGGCNRLAIDGLEPVAQCGDKASLMWAQR